MKTNSFNYSLLVENTKERYLQYESTFLNSPFKKTKYALIEKQHFSDNSEGINRIMYSNNIDSLREQMKTYPSWYDYIAGKSKNLQGYISDLP